jgi:hypothetical protein
MEVTNPYGVTIDANAINSQYTKVQSGASFSNKTSFDPTNYLNVGLDPKEDRRTIVIRLLPYSKEANTPFQEVWMHTVKVSKEVQANGFKRIPCVHKNKLKPTMNDCPFCVVSDKAKKMASTVENATEREQYNEIKKSNSAKPNWIIRCIERGKENEGVKFWCFSHQFSGKDGIYDKMMDLAFDNPDKNIFDLVDGYDLKITIKRSSNKYIYSISLGEKRSLTDDIELGKSWVNDEKTWEKLFTPKSYEYMEVLVNGGVPVFDPITKVYVDKNSKNAIKAKEEAETKETQSKEIKKVEAQYTNPAVEGVNVDDDDLPF